MTTECDQCFKIPSAPHYWFGIWPITTSANYPQRFFWNKWRNNNEGGLLTQLHLGNHD